MEHREKKDLDQIQIRGLRVYAYHGVKESEKEKGQPFELDITLWTDIRRAGATDRLEDTINYSEGVTVCLKKPRAPIAADFAYVAVEITRWRES